MATFQHIDTTSPPAAVDWAAVGDAFRSARAAKDEKNALTGELEAFRRELDPTYEAPAEESVFQRLNPFDEDPASTPLDLSEASPTALMGLAELSPRQREVVLSGETDRDALNAFKSPGLGKGSARGSGIFASRGRKKDDGFNSDVGKMQEDLIEMRELNRVAEESGGAPIFSERTMADLAVEQARRSTGAGGAAGTLGTLVRMKDEELIGDTQFLDAITAAQGGTAAFVDESGRHVLKTPGQQREAALAGDVLRKQGVHEKSAGGGGAGGGKPLSQALQQAQNASLEMVSYGILPDLVKRIAQEEGKGREPTPSELSREIMQSDLMTAAQKSAAFAALGSGGKLTMPPIPEGGGEGEVSTAEEGPGYLDRAANFFREFAAGMARSPTTEEEGAPAPAVVEPAQAQPRPEAAPVAPTPRTPPTAPSPGPPPDAPVATPQLIAVVQQELQTKMGGPPTVTDVLEEIERRGYRVR